MGRNQNKSICGIKDRKKNITNRGIKMEFFLKRTRNKGNSHNKITNAIVSQGITVRVDSISIID